MDTLTPEAAEAIADELHSHVSLLRVMDSHPTTNAVMIETHRRMAIECVEQLGAYLQLSTTFLPVGAL